MTDRDDSTPSTERVRNWMADYLVSVLEVERENFPMDKRFDLIGLDSVEAVIMAGMMEEEFGTEVDPRWLYDHPSVAKFADYFVTTFSRPAGGT